MLSICWVKGRRVIGLWGSGAPSSEFRGGNLQIRRLPPLGSRLQIWSLPQWQSRRLLPRWALNPNLNQRWQSSNSDIATKLFFTLKRLITLKVPIYLILKIQLSGFQINWNIKVCFKIFRVVVVFLTPTMFGNNFHLNVFFYILLGCMCVCECVWT